MSFLARVLEPPSYGFTRNGTLYVPTVRELFREFLSRLNVFADRRNWLTVFSWSMTLVMIVPFTLFFTQYITFPLFILGFVYSMVLMGTHGTVYYHRYSTHRAFQFALPIWRFVVKHAMIKVVIEEVYVVSHHVHHAFSEKPGDPYNVNGGWWYCFLADANHQALARDLTEAEYYKVTAMLKHTGIRMNTYDQYRYWGSVCHPFFTTINLLFNWSFWFAVFYWMGGMPLAVTLFAAAGVWGIGIRTFNYEGHGAGKDKRKDGIDFNREDLSINQAWPGLISGEWHNNHHLYPNGARAGFQPYQFDPAWYVIKGLAAIGGIASYRDYTQDFYEKYYKPYLLQRSQRAARAV